MDYKKIIYIICARIINTCLKYFFIEGEKGIKSSAEEDALLRRSSKRSRAMQRGDAKSIANPILYSTMQTQAQNL